MKTLLIGILVVIMTGLITKSSFAQTQAEDSVLYLIETQDGNEYIGRIISRDDVLVIFATQSLGDIRIKTSEIVKISEIEPDKLIMGDYWFENPQESRYFWAPSGYGLKSGEGYYQNVWIFFNQFAVGITDNVSIGAGLVPLFLFGGASTPVWITPKISIPVSKDKFNLGVGALVGTVIGEENSGFGVAYGMATLGSRDQNVSFGLGYGFSGGDFASKPTITVSGMFRTGPRGYVLTENYFISAGEEDLLLISFGGRRIIKKVGLDFGGFIPITEDSGVFVIPWLGLTVPFGNIGGIGIQ